jgi:hypothetical protein
MGCSKVEVFEEVERGMICLLRLWKCVEKTEDGRAREQSQGETSRDGSHHGEGDCGAQEEAVVERLMVSSWTPI